MNMIYVGDEESHVDSDYDLSWKWMATKTATPKVRDTHKFQHAVVVAKPDMCQLILVDDLVGRTSGSLWSIGLPGVAYTTF